jgi:YVTN family beta-propeller protein
MRRILMLAALVSALGANAAAQGAATLVVLNKSDNTVSFVDPQTLKVLGTAPTGNGPHEAAASADGKRIYVANYGDQKPGSSLSIIDAGERKELTRFELPGLVRPHGIVEAGGNIYFTAEGSAAVARFNPTRNTEEGLYRQHRGRNGDHAAVAALPGPAASQADQSRPRARGHRHLSRRKRIVGRPSQ